MRSGKKENFFLSKKEERKLPFPKETRSAMVTWAPLLPGTRQDNLWFPRNHHSSNRPRKAAVWTSSLCRPGCLVLPRSLWREGMEEWGEELMTGSTELTASVESTFLAVTSVRLARPGRQHSLQRTWIFSKSASPKETKLANSPKTPAQKFYEPTIKETFIFFNGVLY